MTASDALRLEGRVLAIAPTGKDAETTKRLLESAGIDVALFTTFAALVTELERGAAVVVLPEEVLSQECTTELSSIVLRQPAWSDLPVLVLTRTGADSIASREAVRMLGNVTLLERPVQVATLLSAVRAALRARERQIQIRDHLLDRALAEESLRLADQRKDEFLATLGHELRNPLAPLVTGLQLLRTSGVDNPRVLGVAAVMGRQLQHLVRLVDDLLEVSRITRGLVEIHREPVDLVAVIRSAIETSRPALDNAKHVLSTAFPSEPIAVAGDVVRLTQVFANLLTNAAKYTDVGGHVWLSVARAGDRVQVSVRDDGIGIPAEHLTSVFEMFTQVNRSNRRAQGGLGIGLTLVRSLVALHDGHVEARSRGTDQGSEFIVDLPTVPHPVAALSAGSTLGPFPPRRVLVVDDNADAADMLASVLEAKGLTVAVVKDGPMALARLPEFAPDAVLLDIGMPEMDGYTVARRIRAMPEFPAILLIALTGWGQDQDVQRAREAGFDHHLVKPPNLERLRQVMLEGWPQALPTQGSPSATAARVGS